MIMRKIYLLLLAFCAISCVTPSTKDTKPLSKFKGGIFMGQAGGSWGYKQVKNVYIEINDTLIVVEVLKLEVENLKVGDTIKPKNK